MSVQRPKYRRSLPLLRDVTDSILSNHPLPETTEYLKSSFPEMPFDEDLFDLKNNANQEFSERHDPCPPFINKQEASYGSMLSILSGNSSQTISSCSFDEESEGISENILAMFERTDNALFDEKLAEDMNEKLKEDCLTWSKMFPHFRLIGKEVILHAFADESLLNNNSMSEILYSTGSEESHSECEETIKECYDDDHEFSFEKQTNNADENISKMERLKKKVIAKLVKHLVTTSLEWKSATGFEEPKPLRIRTATASTRRERLRPMTAQESHRASLPPVVSTTLRPLDGILVVSSKVLQNRKSLNYLSRPGSSVTRVKTGDRDTTKLHLLKGRLSKLPDNLEDVEEGRPTLRNRSFTAQEPSSLHFLANSIRVQQELPDHLSQLELEHSMDFKNNKLRPLSLPPVHADFREHGKNIKKPVQRTALNRPKMNNIQVASRPPSAREFSKIQFEELDAISYQGPLPMLVEENNFLKILPIARNSSAHQSRQRLNSLNNLGTSYRKT